MCEVWETTIHDSHINEKNLGLILDRMKTNSSTSPVEVGGWDLVPVQTIRKEASALGAKKYAPWLLVALDQCHACWHTGKCMGAILVAHLHLVLGCDPDAWRGTIYITMHCAALGLAKWLRARTRMMLDHRQSIGPEGPFLWLEPHHLYAG